MESVYFISILRSFFGAIIVAFTAHQLVNILHLLKHKNRIFSLLMAPFFAPSIVLGYVYSEITSPLIHYPILNECFYVFLLILKWTPVAVIILYFYPKKRSSEAEFLINQCSKNPHRPQKDSYKRPFIITGFIFTLFLSDFELAARLQTQQWTVSVFDMQAGGMTLNETLKMVYFPLVLQIITLLGILGMLFKHLTIQSQTEYNVAHHQNIHFSAKVLFHCYLISSLILTIAYPAIKLFFNAYGVFGDLFKNFQMGKDLSASLIFALFATIAAYFFSGFTEKIQMHSHKKLFFIAITMIPGLLGSLILSFLLLSIFKMPLRDTPIPLFLTHFFLLLPMAYILKFAINAKQQTTSNFLLNILQKSKIRNAYSAKIFREKIINKKIWSFFLLFFWIYFELTASAILAPSQMTPVLVRLYNLMHYGHYAGYAAQLCIILICPLFVFIILKFSAHFFYFMKKTR